MLEFRSTESVATVQRGSTRTGTHSYHSTLRVKRGEMNMGFQLLTMQESGRRQSLPRDRYVKFLKANSRSANRLNAVKPIPFLLRKEEVTMGFVTGLGAVKTLRVPDCTSTMV